MAKKPPLAKKVRVSFYLPVWIAKRLRTIPNQSVFLEQLIMRFTGWQRPGAHLKANKEVDEKLEATPRRKPMDARGLENYLDTDTNDATS